MVTWISYLQVTTCFYLEPGPFSRILQLDLAMYIYNYLGKYRQITTGNIYCKSVAYALRMGSMPFPQGHYSVMKLRVPESVDIRRLCQSIVVEFQVRFCADVTVSIEHKVRAYAVRPCGVPLRPNRIPGHYFGREAHQSTRERYQKEDKTTPTPMVVWTQIVHK
jgi:hypothetical protein